jgi:hypothetical protein
MGGTLDCAMTTEKGSHSTASSQAIRNRTISITATANKNLTVLVTSSGEGVGVPGNTTHPQYEKEAENSYQLVLTAKAFLFWATLNPSLSAKS